MSADFTNAACRRVDTDLMYPDDNDHKGVHRARRVCATCPIQAQCLQRALDDKEPFGVWGGFSHVERIRLGAGVTAQPCTNCGLRFVPRLTTQYRCPRCAQDVHARDGDGACESSLAPQRELVAALAADGKSDAQIGVFLGVTTKRVFLARQRWGIAPGFGRLRAGVAA